MSLIQKRQNAIDRFSYSMLEIINKKKIKLESNLLDESKFFNFFNNDDIYYF